MPKMTLLRQTPLVAPLAAIAVSALGLALLATPVHARTVNRGVEPVHQPVVERTDFVFDVRADGDGDLDATSRHQLVSWFDALGLGYGDRITFAGPQDYDSAKLRDAVNTVVARYGLLTQGDAPVTAGSAPAGELRIVVSRSQASVPDCPSWRDKSEVNLSGGLSDNYGCAMATNLAAMVADPQDLVEGRTTRTDLRAATSSRAIQAYEKKAPSGAGDLQGTSVGGN